MKGFRRSLATVLLAATVPLLVFAGPRGGIACTVALVRLLSVVKECGGPDVNTDAQCELVGHPNCTYSVDYVGPNGTGSTTLDVGVDGHAVIHDCEVIQRKACVICRDGSCPTPEAP